MQLGVCFFLTPEPPRQFVAVNDASDRQVLESIFTEKVLLELIDLAQAQQQ